MSRGSMVDQFTLARLLIEIAGVGQRCINPLHEVVFSGDGLGSEPRLPDFGQAFSNNILFTFPRGNLLPDVLDRLLQERNVQRQVTTILELTMPADDDRIVVDAIQDGGERTRDALHVQTGCQVSPAAEKVADDYDVRRREIHDGVAVGVPVGIMIEFDVLTGEMNGDRIAEGDTRPGTFRIWTNRHRRPRRGLLGYQAFADIFVRDNHRIRTVNLVAADVVVMPMSVQEKSDGLFSKIVEGFLDDGMGGGLRMIHEQIAVGTGEHDDIVEVLGRLNANRSEEHTSEL